MVHDDEGNAPPAGKTLLQPDPLNPYPTKPRVTFRADGTFKLTVFSDLHYGENPNEDWGPEQDRNSTRLMRAVLADERPDYAVINGDLITGENTFKFNVTKLIDQIVEPLNEVKVPFSCTHGNHDNQVNITHREEILYEQRIAPLSYTRAAPIGVGGESGPGNYWVPVYHHTTDPAPSLVLWFFDSRGGITSSPTPRPLPDWVDASVAGWIESETRRMERAWGPAHLRSAVAFMHIPPHVAQSLQPGLDSVRNPGRNDDHLGQGSVQDASGPQPADPASTKDRPFWDALNAHIANLRVVISGHDHGNEWCKREPEKSVIFCFNKHSGYGGYDREGWGHGVRNLVFRSPDPRDDIDTWIRFEDGTKGAEIVLNDGYV
ncbi:hypothetical protein AX16_006384 [Volvariella volvacea WC 439]|nr:hypothetical protein AX16_006384 [Volvariella volvacea WC 439]